MFVFSRGNKYSLRRRCALTLSSANNLTVWQHSRFRRLVLLQPAPRFERLLEPWQLTPYEEYLVHLQSRRVDALTGESENRRVIALDDTTPINPAGGEQKLLRRHSPLSL